MEVVQRATNGLFFRRHPGFGTLVFSPFSGLFFAVADKYSDGVVAYGDSKPNNLPDTIINHLNVGLKNGNAFEIENWLPNKVDFAEIDHLPDKYPIVINWLISNKCNCCCSYCYAGDVIDKPFKNADVVSIANNLLELNPLVIVLSGGEPLLQKEHLLQILPTIGDRSGIIIDTNGLLFYDDLIPLLTKYHVVMRVSIDSLKPDVNSKLRPQHNKCDDKEGVAIIVDNIQRYREAGIPVFVHTVLSTMNKKSIEDLSFQLPKLGINGWRVLSVIRPNDQAKKDTFDEVMCVGTIKNIEKAEKDISEAISQYRHRFKSISNFYIQFIEGGAAIRRNSVLLVLPDGRLMTESMFVSSKTIVNKDEIFKKVDLRSHYERYLGVI